MERVPPKPTLPGARLHAAVRLLSMTLLLSCMLGSASAQESLPPSVEAQIAPGIQALKSGDLDTAEKVFSEAQQRGIKHPLIFHNLELLLSSAVITKRQLLDFARQFCCNRTMVLPGYCLVPAC